MLIDIMMTIILIAALGVVALCVLFMLGILLLISYQDCGIHLKENDDEILSRKTD